MFTTYIEIYTPKTFNGYCVNFTEQNYFGEWDSKAATSVLDSFGINDATITNIVENSKREYSYQYLKNFYKYKWTQLVDSLEKSSAIIV